MDYPGLIDMENSHTQPVAAPALQEVNTLVSLLGQGRYTKAVTLARMMTVRFPLHGFGWKVLGVALKQMGQNADALVPMQKATVLSPNDAEAYNNLGTILHDLGRLDEAEASLQRALQLDHNNAQAYYNLGNTLKELNRLNEAEASYRQALQINPDDAETHSNLGIVLNDMGRPHEAEASYRQALQINPDNADALYNMGVILEKLGRLDEAEASYRRALQINPDYAGAHNNLGNTLQELGRLDEAEASYRRALQIKPDYAEVHNHLGLTLMYMGQLGKAEASFRQALQINPDYAEVYNNLGLNFRYMGRLDEAEAACRRALQINPDYADAHGNLLFLLNYTSSNNPALGLAEARQYGQKISNKIAARFTEWLCAKQPERLRIGFVSGDFRNHPVGYFLEGLLARLDPASVELIAYPTCPTVDELTERIKPHFSAWKPLLGLGDEAAARLIHSDGVHVLIDVSGHTLHNRLSVFAWKPAPVQASWLGYLATTGIAEIDYLIADHWTLPETQEAYFTEKIWRLPETYLCFTPPNVEIPVSALPALANGYVTFGCFNHLAKMNDDVVTLWSRVLASVPGSRLFLKTKQLNEASVRQSILERFSSHGIDTQRLILEGSVRHRAEHLARYHRVDIALDPFPYSGITTSVEGLWMGVPMLTLAGKSFMSRQGVGLLMNAGLPEWVAADADDYVARAVAHAGDLQGLAALRGRLRQQALASPIFDARRFATHFESALHDMWRIWCEKQQ
jgi:predicted O-linked N-acetylglucosamine transferase (SPINDLY family)